MGLGLGLLGAGKKWWKKDHMIPKEKRDPQAAHIEEMSAEQRRKDAMNAGEQFTQIFLDEKDRDERDLRNELAFAFGLVTKVVDIKSRGAGCPAAMRAIEKEVDNIRQKEALYIESLMGREDAKKLHPEAEYVDARLLLARRNVEFTAQGEESGDYKARIIVQGCGQRDVYDQVVVDEVIQTVPANMEEQKLGQAHQAAFDDGVGLVADVDGAYLTTLLRRRDQVRHHHQGAVRALPAAGGDDARPGGARTKNVLRVQARRCRLRRTVQAHFRRARVPADPRRRDERVREVADLTDSLPLRWAASL